MAKIILSSAIAFFAVMTVFTSAAEACISCEYVPAVVHSSPPSDSAKRYKKKRAYRATKKRGTRAVKMRIGKRKTTAKKRIGKRKTTAKKVETAKTAPIKSETDIQNSTTSTASLDNDEPKTSSYVGCKTSGKTLSIGCVVAKARPSEMTKNFGRLSVRKLDQLVSGPQESKTLLRGAFGNTEQ
jgi:hypothetical protein